MRLYIEDDDGMTWLLEEDIPADRGRALMARAKLLNDAVVEAYRRGDAALLGLSCHQLALALGYLEPAPVGENVVRLPRS